MTAPSEKQIAILKKYHKDIPGTIQEASQIISELFGKKEEKLAPNGANLDKKGLPPFGKSPTSDNLKLACDTVSKYVELCKQLGYPNQYWNLSTVFNTMMMKK